MKEYILKIQGEGKVELKDNETIEEYIEKLFKDYKMFLETFQFEDINHERVFRRMS